MRYSFWSKRQKRKFWIANYLFSGGICLSSGLILVSVILYLFVVSIDFALFFLSVYIIANNYKLKYFFLGKNFKEQYIKLLEMQKLNPNYYSYFSIKQLKHNYMRTGNILSIIGEDTCTPISDFYENARAFNYYNASDKEKLEFVIFQLYNNQISGGGLYKTFESLTENEPFTYEEFYRLISNCSVFSTELKNLLLAQKCKGIYEQFKNYKNITEKEHKELENFELNYSRLIDKFENELFNIVEKISIANYINSREQINLPQGWETLFLNQNNNTRVFIWYDETIKAYKIGMEQFQFFCNDSSSTMYMLGGWVCSPMNFGIYDTLDHAQKDISNIVSSYKKIQNKDLFNNS